MSQPAFIFIVGPDHDNSPYASTEIESAQKFVRDNIDGLRSAGATVHRVSDMASLPKTGPGCKKFTLEEFIGL